MSKWWGGGKPTKVKQKNLETHNKSESLDMHEWCG